MLSEPTAAPPTVGGRIRFARDLVGVSQKRLTKEAELATGHLSKIENTHSGKKHRGVRPSTGTVKKIVKALNRLGVVVTADWIRHANGVEPQRKQA